MDVLYEVIVTFFIGKVIINYIIGHWIAKQLVKLFKRYARSTPRTDAILHHYLARANKQGHQPEDVLDCNQERCAVVFG
jgi:hypothetical protein